MARPKEGYRNAKGEKIPGVTTIIGNRVNPGGLMWWANRIAYEPLMQARALLGRVVDPSEPMIPEGTIKQFLAINPETFDHNKAARLAADAGTLCHEMVQAHLLGERPESVYTSDHTPEIIAKAETAYLAFLEWAEHTNLKVEETELSLVSERYQFGGTMDACVLSINGRRGLGDWKSANGLYADHLIQLGGYSLLWREDSPWKERKLDGYHLFRFDKETANFTHKQFNDITQAEEAFLCLRRLYELDKTLNKLMK